MTRLDNSQFLKQLNELASQNQGKSSIYLTQKRLSENKHHPKPDDLPTNVASNDKVAPNEQTYPVLIRVSMNSSDNRKSASEKVKLSTVVEVAQLNQFWSEYIQVVKNGFVGLKKREKKNKNKKNKIAK
ncbi:uncharacterized protein LODBEIA_P51820 [Lodderomyces beijingensis]|uniref:Signal recognition particle subunit SRP14 n=1 Tax=Lodderomyces beijingensis TaxID=1775926 RepID=A0ABP0ZS44_9ASCO